MVLLDPQSGSVEYGYDGLITRGDGDSIKFVLRCADEYLKECRAAGCRPLSELAKKRVTHRLGLGGS